MASSGGGSNPFLLIGCGLLLCVGGGVYVYSSQTAPSVVKKIVVEGEGALACTEIRVNGKTAECILPMTEYDTWDADDLQEQAGVTKDALAPQGTTRLLLRTDDGKLRGSY